MELENFGLYVHIPFCTRRCAYCDFNTYAGMQHLIPDYVTGLVEELLQVKAFANLQYPLTSIYFGGGTPSLLPIAQLERILNGIQSVFSVIAHPEITMEVNPTSISKEYLQNLVQLGVTRLSVGMQSALQQELDLLGRSHTLKDVEELVTWSFAAGFSNLNLDLIYGIPNQTLADWQKSLNTALQFSPTHLSLYALTLEEHTPLHKKIHNGLCQLPDDDLVALMYERSCALLEEAGFCHYEISNWAMRSQDNDFRSQHNLTYWRSSPYIGIGAGAHSYYNHSRWENIQDIQQFCKAIHNQPNTGQPHAAVLNYAALSPTVEMGEFMLMGLRLLEEGVADATFQQRFGKSLFTHYQKEIDDLAGKGLLEVDNQNRFIRLSPPAWLLANQVLMQFV